MSNKAWPARRIRAIVWAILAILVTYFFRNWLGSGLPTSPRSEALAPYTYIWQIADYLKAGYLYVDWDATFFAGYPWLRFLQYPVYYTVAVLSLLPGVSLSLAIKLFIIFTYMLSGWTMSELVVSVVRQNCDDLRIAWSAGLVAGAAYALFPFHLHLGIEIISHGTFWAFLPLPFLAFERMLMSRGLATGLGASAAGQGDSVGNVRAGRWHTGLPLGLAMALFAVTDIEHTLIMTPFVAIYILLRAAPILRRQWRWLLRLLISAVLVAIGLTAFYTLPGLAELPQIGISARFGEGGTANEQFARDTGVSIGALLAGAADRAGITYRPADLPYIVFGFFGANSWYLGIAAVALAILAMLWLRRSPVVAVALALLLISFAWAARAWLPLNPFRPIPFFGTLSGFRGMILIGFFLCLLAGYGVAWLLSSLKSSQVQVGLAVLALAVLALDRPRPTMGYVAEVVGVLALLALVIMLARRSPLPGVLLAALLLVGLVAIDYRTASAAVVSLPGYFQADELDAYRWLSEQGSGFRIWEYSDLYDDNEFLHTFSLPYNQTPRFGGYYDNGATTGQWHLYKWAKPERGAHESIEALGTALKLSSVRYVLLHKRIATYEHAVSSTRQAGFDVVAWQSANVTILEDRGWRPMARLYTEALPVSDGYKEELAALPAADRANWAINAVSAGGQAVQTTITGELATITTPQPATVTRLSPYVIKVETKAGAPGMLVLSESWHPNWQASVDGKPVSVERVNVAFMGVRLDAGKHDVLYSYRLPPALIVGWVITVLTALALVVGTGLRYVRHIV